MSASNVKDSGVKKVSNQYQYQYYYDISNDNGITDVVFMLVGTAMNVSAYPDLAKQTVSQYPTNNKNRAIVFCMVDHNPGIPIKLYGKLAVVALNDLVANLPERFADVSLSSSPSTFIGGHSAGGSAAIDAIKDLKVRPDGFIAVDPYGVPIQLFWRKEWSSISKKHIPFRTLAFGFTETTCGVGVEEAGKAAYQVGLPTDRVLVQIQNKKNEERKREQITHCIFADDGCGGKAAAIVCPSHSQGAWVRQVAGACIGAFVSSTSTSRTVYEGWIRNEVNLFVNDEQPPTKKVVPAPVGRLANFWNFFFPTQRQEG